ncbi:hypothetical protein DPQ22_05020 [Candidatus Tokpelaia sp.]|nr:hypothetical protein DPQ22_05020 [Candidatus Tokpelaia sp.]
MRLTRTCSLLHPPLQGRASSPGAVCPAQARACGCLTGCIARRRIQLFVRFAIWPPCLNSYADDESNSYKGELQFAFILHAPRAPSVCTLRAPLRFARSARPFGF